jgi:hypothetical protein
MNNAHPNHEFVGSEDDRLIDRLVDAELPDGERRQLLLRLEHTPNGWRRCALAFLEAQSWRASLRSVNALTPYEAPQPAPGRRRVGPRQWTAVARWTVLAAGLAVAFILGWCLSDRTPHITREDRIVENRLPDSTQPAQGVQSDANEGTTRIFRPAEPSGRLRPVVKQWERDGYHAEMQHRRVAMELKDGRRIDVPVQEVRLQYVRGRIY